ncbi:hypothetical protein TNCT_607191 [Trichonephila clavata]|uniref:Uncharacterized protein n=1 Tax=Trichonephila clavata TaxID=2740835 RepID=A0A8X6F730_TRICU|nr:hypothetical protein TNCT_607191 [Trichonephila clavata]
MVELSYYFLVVCDWDGKLEHLVAIPLIFVARPLRSKGWVMLIEEVLDVEDIPGCILSFGNNSLVFDLDHYAIFCIEICGQVGSDGEVFFPGDIWD